jgi:hypothetical protein
MWLNRESLQGWLRLADVAIMLSCGLLARVALQVSIINP